MNRKLVLALALTLLIGILNVAFNAQRAKAIGAIYIRADGSIDPLTAPISTLDNVTYTLTDNIVGDVPSGSSAIIIEKDNITIDGAGHTLQGARTLDSTGIMLTGRSNVTIRNTNITAFYKGISLDFSSNNSIVANNITANEAAGVYLSYSSNNSISGNNITNNGYYGVELGLDAYNNSLVENRITANEDGVWLSDYSRNSSLIGNNVTANNRYGIAITGSPNNTLRSNRMTNNKYNFHVYARFLSDLDSNEVDVSNTVDGKPIYYWVGRWNMTVPLDAGFVALLSCWRITVQGLNLQSNGFGLIMAYTHQSIITQNNITNNKIGLWLTQSDDNLFYHNNFIDNDQGELILYYSRYHTVWDNGYPSGGNYWSDYAGVDLHSSPNQTVTGSDGIGDTPYAIDENNVVVVYDHYPLIAPYCTFDAGTWDGTAYNVDVISNSTVSDFHFNPSEGALLRFNATGEDGTSGFCRICIPTALMNAPYKVYVNGTEVSHNLLPCSNETRSYLYFNYTHSTQEVIVIPEFPPFVTLSLFMMATLSAIVVSKRKWFQHQTHRARIFFEEKDIPNSTRVRETSPYLRVLPRIR